jgi:hypothetical protein
MIKLQDVILKAMAKKLFVNSLNPAACTLRS